jgi:DNA-binding NarL/FixJ family response regulator
MNPTFETPKPVPPVRLLITNVPTMLLELLRGVFAGLPDFHLCEGADEMSHMPARAQGQVVDVILLGLSIAESKCDATALLEPLSRLSPDAKFMVLAEKLDYLATIALFRAGVRGIVCTKGLRFDLLCKSVRCVHQGQVWASNELVDHLVASLSHPQSREVTDVHGRSLLTAREQQVLHLLAEGLSNRDLAIELKLSAHTVKNHLFRIYEKLGVSNRMEAVLYALTPRESRSDRIVLPERPVDNVRMFRASQTA